VTIARTPLIPALILAVTAVLIITGPGRRSRAVSRLGASLFIGTAAGGVLAAVVDRARHAALAAISRGGHVNTAGSLMDGFAVTALAVTVLSFVLLTVAARRRAAARDLAARRRADRALAEVRPGRWRRPAVRDGDLR
jgi:hypothetical protein